MAEELRRRVVTWREKHLARTTLGFVALSNTGTYVLRFL